MVLLPEIMERIGWCLSYYGGISSGKSQLTQTIWIWNIFHLHSPELLCLLYCMTNNLMTAFCQVHHQEIQLQRKKNWGSTRHSLHWSSCLNLLKWGKNNPFYQGLDLYIKKNHLLNFFFFYVSVHFVLNLQSCEQQLSMFSSFLNKVR